MIKLAIFDIDNTLYRFDTGSKFIKIARKQGVMKVNIFSMLRILKIYTMYKLNLLPFDKIKNLNFGFLKNVNVKKIEKFSKNYGNEVLKQKLEPVMVEKIKNHKKKNYKIMLLTASPSIITKHLADYLKVDYLLTSELEMKNNRYTGKYKILNYAEGKLKTLKHFIEHKKIDLKNSFFYSDSYSDMPVFSIVGNPIAVNPDNKLRKYAKCNNWPIIDFDY